LALPPACITSRWSDDPCQSRGVRSLRWMGVLLGGGIMARQFASGLVVGERVDATFALRSQEIRSARTGEAYLSFEFTDRSGLVGGIMFRPGRDAESLPVGTVVRVRGTVTTYRGVRRISVESIRPAADYDPREILPSSMRDTGEMVRELRAHVRSVADPGLAALLVAVFGDRELMKRFVTCPASREGHHAHIGGLLEHTVAVAAICRRLADLYPVADADLLIAGALLHDIGVADELEFETSIDYTEAGRLLGHSALGERRVLAAARSCTPMPAPGVLDRLSHVILTHHAAGEDVGGVRPRTLEAMLLPQADRLDCLAAEFLTDARGASLVDEPWTAAGVSLRGPSRLERVVSAGEGHGGAVVARSA
ncbi:MAG: HD domain-containing protein, partial [Coriobacteriia bacterium]|nr:HD domain-containing protein [Coriobacteriia bacterium]